MNSPAGPRTLITYKRRGKESNRNEWAWTPGKRNLSVGYSNKFGYALYNIHPGLLWSHLYIGIDFSMKRHACIHQITYSHWGATQPLEELGWAPCLVYIIYKHSILIIIFFFSFFLLQFSVPLNLCYSRCKHYSGIRAVVFWQPWWTLHKLMDWGCGRKLTGIVRFNSCFKGINGGTNLRYCGIAWGIGVEVKGRKHEKPWGTQKLIGDAYGEN